MLIAISGSQGSGKTTILNQLKDRGYNIIERKTSRSILQEWNVSLHEVNNNHDLTIKFQDEILKRKLNDEIHAFEDNKIWFTERTFADLFTYACVSLGKDNSYSSWLDQYFLQCKKYMACYRMIFYVRAGLFVPEHDGVRGSNQHYSRMVDLTMYDFTRAMCNVQFNQMEVIEFKTVQERIDHIVYRTDRLNPRPLFKPILLSDIVG